MLRAIINVFRAVSILEKNGYIPRSPEPTKRAVEYIEVEKSYFRQMFDDLNVSTVLLFATIPLVGLPVFFISMLVYETSFPNRLLLSALVVFCVQCKCTSFISSVRCFCFYGAVFGCAWLCHMLNN